MEGYLSDNILRFYQNVQFDGHLPDGIQIMNPYRENADIRNICSLFYNKFYHDNNPRMLILGINPGRLGAGATGIPFTDTKRLNSDCGIPYNGFVSHEPSSVFIYEMICAFGGPIDFYNTFYINSVCPLGFIKSKENNKFINYNYYDSPLLENSVSDFIIWNLKTQIDIAKNSNVCFCLGTGKNFAYLQKLNNRLGYFKSIIPLEHPRYIMQYKSGQKEKYIQYYLEKFSEFM